MSLIIPANTLASGGYEVDNSLRFNSGSSDELTRTFATATSRKIFTLSFWLKRTVLGAAMSTFFGDTAGSNNADQNAFYFNANNAFVFGGWNNNFFTTTRLFRDTNAFYHFVIAVDTTQSTASNRIKLYVNGTAQSYTSGNGYPAEDADLGITKSGNHSWFGNDGQSGRGNGYLAEAVLIDGTANAVTDFGEFDDSGIWKPIDVSGLTFGNNGFYLEFKGSGTGTNASGMGADTSGNTNHFAVNNLTAVDQSTDTCTNNFATMNPLDNIAASTFSEGNIKIVTASSNTALNTGTIGVISGKWYWEIKNPSPDGAANDEAYVFGIVNRSPSVASYQGSFGGGLGFGLRGNGKIWTGSAETSGWNTYTTNDIVSIAIDFDNGKAYFATNGSYGNSSNPSTGSNGYSFTVGSEFWRPAVNCMETSKTGDFEINFGGTQSFTISSGNTDGNGYGNFEYAVPSGYYSLNTKNLAEFG